MHGFNAAGGLLVGAELHKADLLALAGVVAQDSAGLDPPKLLQGTPHLAYKRSSQQIPACKRPDCRSKQKSLHRHVYEREAVNEPCAINSERVQGKQGLLLWAAVHFHASRKERG